MANTASAALTAGTLADAVIQQEFRLALADRTHILGNPVVEAGFLGFAVGSNVITSNAWDHGTGVAAAVAELTNVSATDFTATPLSVTVERRSFHRNLSDLLRALEPSSALGAEAIAAEAAGTYTQTMMSLWCTAASSATLAENDTGVDTTLAVIEDAAAQVAGSVSIDGLVCVLHPNQMRDLRKDLQTKGIMLTQMPGAGDLLTQRGVGYIGSYGGIDYFTSSHVPLSGTDRVGFIFTKTGLLYGHANLPPAVGSESVILGGGKVRVRYGDGAADFSTKVFYDMAVGVGINAAAICKIITDG